MIINISFENYEETLFDERVTVRLDLPFVPRVGDIIYLPELLLAKLDRIIEDLPRKESNELFDPSDLDPEDEEQKHFLEHYIYVSDVGMKMDDEYPIWVELSDSLE